MRLLKTNVLLRLLNSYLVDSPQPANISYLWNFGSLLAICLIIQILTGAFLALLVCSLSINILSFSFNNNSIKYFPHSREKYRVNKNKTIYKNRFQPFPFYIRAQSQKVNLVNFSLFNYKYFQVTAIGLNRNFSSSNYICIEKNNIKDS